MALEHYFYGNEIPTPTSIKEMILGLVLGADEGDMDALDGETVGPIVAKLVSVYWALLEAADEERSEREYAEACDSGKEADELFRSTYIKNYRSEFRKDAKRSKYSKYLRGDAGDDEDIAEGMPWSDPLGFYKSGEGWRLGRVPRWLPIIAAKAMAQRESYRSVKLSEWHIDAGTPGTREHARLKRDCGAEAAARAAEEMAAMRARVDSGEA
jgi:hypothetical protein